MSEEHWEKWKEPLLFERHADTVLTAIDRTTIRLCLEKDSLGDDIGLWIVRYINLESFALGNDPDR